MDVVTELCDVVTVLDGGQVIAEGAPDEVKRHPKVIEAYLGASQRLPGPPTAPSRRPAADEETGMLVVEDLHAGYGASEVLVGTSLDVKARRRGGAHRRQRRRQDHHHARHLRPASRPPAAEVLLDGKPVQGLDASRIARLGLAHSPEGRKVFGPLSVEDNLLLGAYRQAAPLLRLPHPGPPADLDARLRALPAPRGAAPASWPARSPAASSRCSPSAAPSWPAPR